MVLSAKICTTEQKVGTKWTVTLCIWSVLSKIERNLHEKPEYCTNQKLWATELYICVILAAQAWVGDWECGVSQTLRPYEQGLKKVGVSNFPSDPIRLGCLKLFYGHILKRK